jgi:hypothetical protein
MKEPLSAGQVKKLLIAILEVGTLSSPVMRTRRWQTMT